MLAVLGCVWLCLAVLGCAWLAFVNLKLRFPFACCTGFGLDFHKILDRFWIDLTRFLIELDNILIFWADLIRSWLDLDDSLTRF